MATAWISGIIGNAVAGTVAPVVSSAGSFAGGAVSAVGDGINGVGSSIEGTIRRYGDGAKDYGNAIRDWTGADGPRVGTARNPLGLSDTAGGGKRGVTSPTLYNGGVPKSKPKTQVAITNGKAIVKPANSGPFPSTAVGAPRKLPEAAPKAALPQPKPAAKPATKPAVKSTTAYTPKKPVTATKAPAGGEKKKPQGRPPPSAANPLGL